MWKLSLPFLLLTAVPVFGQLPPHTLTIAATRSINLQPDQVLFSLSVSSGAASTLDQIVAALSGLGITSSNLTGVFNNPTPPNFQWDFTLAAPLSNLTATIGSLTKLQQTITQNNSGLTLTFYVDGTRSISTTAAIAIVLKFRSDCRCNGSGAENVSRGWIDAGAYTQLVEHAFARTDAGDMPAHG